MAFPLDRVCSKTSTALLLTALLIFASLQSSFAAEWVKYDDGESNSRRSTTTGRQLFVKFSLPLYYQKYRIISVSFYVYDLAPFRAHVFKPGHSCADLFVSDIVPAPTTGAHWIEVTMPPEIIVTGYGSDLDAFFVSIEYLTNDRPEIGFDTDRWNLYANYPDLLEFRSYEGRPSWDWNCALEATELPGDLMIRAMVAESDEPTFKEAVPTTTATQTASAQASGMGLAFVMVGIGAGVAVALAGFGVALTQQTQHCRYCGNRVARYSRYCQYCGRLLV